MSAVLRDLAHNLAGGARVVFGAPVSVLRFRIGVPQLLVLFLFSGLLDLAVDTLRREPGSMMTILGLVGEGFYGGLLMLFAALLALLFRQPSLVLSLPVVILASEWPLQAARLIIALVLRADPALLGPAIRTEQIILIWAVFWLWRSAAVCLRPTRPHYGTRSLVALLLLATPLWLGPMLLPDMAWWRPAPAAEQRDTSYPSPASEAVLAAQPKLLEDALADLEDERKDTTDLYFVGFAPFADEDVFRKDMEVARDLMDSRFDTEDRSVLLINNPRTVLERPFATVSNLRETLNEIGAAIDREDDVVMLYLESHGNRNHSLAAEFAPLELDPLFPEMLRTMLDEAKIKWRIIVVSACYSGGFIEPLKDDHTLILTASAADRTSFGCGNDSNATFFADAFFQNGLRFEDSFLKAFADARERIAAREQKEGVKPPSDPQMFVGTEMAAKLPKLEETLRARRSGSNI